MSFSRKNCAFELVFGQQNVTGITKISAKQETTSWFQCFRVLKDLNVVMETHGLRRQGKARMSLVVVAVVLITIDLVAGSCPHDLDLAKWSDNSSWVANGLQGLPEAGEAVKIKNKILLDVNPGFDLKSIEIEAGGQLVFSPEVEISLRLRYILVKGRLDIGSEDCPYTGNATITLLGRRKEKYSVNNFGRKFIGVQAGGTLEIHGKYKLPWTKLTSTLEKFPSKEFLFRKKVTKRGKVQGILVYSFDPNTGRPDRKMGVFRMQRRKQKMADRDISKFIKYVKDIPKGNVVAIAIRKTIIPRNAKLDISALYKAIEVLAFGSVTGNSKIRQLEFYDGYSLILVQGDPSETVEQFDAYRFGVKRTSTTTMIRESKNMKIEVTNGGRSFVDFQVTNTNKTVPILDLVDDVSSWQEGDEVVIASTDYNWAQHEYAKVIKCDTCSATQVRISLTPRFTHYGEITHNVDMRAEVAVLTRNVIIKSGMVNGQDTFGGHIKVIKGFERVRVENAELVNLGTSNIAGMHPMYWHMCETPKNPTYIRSCAIHHTFARCVAVRGTHKVQVIDNTCVESLGHAYFLEDGGEKYTVFDGNLGLGQRRLHTRIRSERYNPTTFWITNPYTVLRNNAAAGSQGHGIWYVFPEKPMGRSRKKNFMRRFQARRTPITEFYNNVAHSNAKNGLRIDDRLAPNGRVLPGNFYQPASTVTISRLTAYKNVVTNARIRGNKITVTQASLSDSVVGILMLRRRRGKIRLQNSVIVGDSDNKGQPTRAANGTIIADRSLPRTRKRFLPRYGIDIYSNEICVENVWFCDFHQTDKYNAGALHFGNGFGLISPVENALFGFDDPSDGNRFIEQKRPLKHRLHQGIQDVDGSLTTVAKSWIVHAIPFHMTSNCKKRVNWNMAVCVEEFVQVQAYMRASARERMTMHRLDSMASLSLPKNRLNFNLIVGKMYGVSFGTKIPRDFYMRAVNMAKNDSIVIGMCVPRRAQIRIGIVGYTREKVSKLDEVIYDTCGGKYYYDRKIGMLFVKLMGKKSVTKGKECSRTRCPGFKIRITRGNLLDKFCIKRYAKKYAENSLRFLMDELNESERSIELPSVLEKTSAEPPEGIGAGSTRNETYTS